MGPARDQSLFEFYVALVLTKTPTYILVFADGSVQFATREQYHISLEEKSLNHNYILISLNRILEELLPGMDFYSKSIALKLKYEEIEMINLLRSNKNHEITIKYADQTEFIHS